MFRAALLALALIGCAPSGGDTSHDFDTGEAVAEGDSSIGIPCVLVCGAEVWCEMVNLEGECGDLSASLATKEGTACPEAVGHVFDDAETCNDALAIYSEG